MRQRLGVPVLSDDGDRAEVAGACAEFVRRGVLGVRPAPALGAREWVAAVRAATEGLEFGQSGGESVRRTESSAASVTTTGFSGTSSFLPKQKSLRVESVYTSLVPR